MTIKQKFSSIDQSKLTADQKAFLTKIKDVTKNFTDAEMNKKVEAPLDGFIAKAKEKMPEAIKSAPVKKTGKAKTSQTRKPKRTAMSLAKEIRKEGESWKDAQARASKMMKEDSKDLSKTVETELDKLSKLVKSQKERKKLSGLSGTNIRRDSARKAKPQGRRISKNGKVYYENRDNRTDRLAPNYPKNAPYLANGGSVTNERKHVNKAEDYEVRYTRKGKFLGVFKEGGAIKNQYAGRTPEDIWDSLTVEQRKHFLIDHLWANEEQIEQIRYKRLEEDDKSFVDYYAVRTWKKLSGDVRKAFTSHVKEGEYNKGGALTNERLHVNHDEDYEVRYAKPRPSRKGYKGARKFMAGGMNNETPRIYVADLEAYNNGRLEGEWLDLSDYNNADELMDAIQDVLKKSGGEEYAIHDVEYIPSSMYSEYMGKRDFEELYEMMELAKDNDLPLEVVQYIVSQYSTSAVDDFYGKFDNAEDFAYQQVEEFGLENFNNPEYYVYITETDRRLLSQEMADSYVDDIRNEDGGNRLIEEAGMNVDEYEEADSETQEEMLDKAREIVYDEYYDTWFEGLEDPYYFLVDEQGMYSSDDFFKASFIGVDYEKLARDLEQDYTFIEYDGDLYVFNIR
jgi:antirestriction protein